MTVVRMGDRAARFPRPDGVAPRAIVETCRAWPAVCDVVVAPRDIAVYFDRAGGIVEDAWLSELAARAGEGDAPARAVVLRTIYDGDDLDALRAATGLDVAAIHAAADYTVDAMGFQPGFAYLRGLDARIHAPRLPTPRTRVPAGAIGIAGELTGVYPFASPGGWRLIGRVVDAPMFDDRGPRLQLGDRVRFAREPA